MHDEFDFHDFDEQLEDFKKNPPKKCHCSIIYISVRLFIMMD